MHSPTDEEIATKEQIARDQPVPTVLSDAELKTWHRRVGRMSYEQAKALSATLNAQRDHHHETGCPLCRWITEFSRNDLCPVGEELDQVRRGARPTVWIMAAGDATAEQRIKEEMRLGRNADKALVHHLDTCPDCVRLCWHHVESCEYGNQLTHMWHYAVHREYDAERKAEVTRDAIR